MNTKTNKPKYTAADGNSNAMTVAEFTTKAKCQAAGAAAKQMAQGTVKSIEFVCAEK